MQILSHPWKPLNIYDWDNVLCNTIKLYCSLINELWGAAVCGLFTRCITVGICLLSSGGYVTAELDKTWRGDRTAQRTTLVHVHIHTHRTVTLASRPCCNLKPSYHLWLVWARCYPAVCMCVMQSAADVWAADLVGRAFHWLQGTQTFLPSPHTPCPAKSSIRDQM